MIAYNTRLALPLILATLLLAGCQPEGADPQFPAPEVTVATLHEQPVRHWETYTGRIEARDVIYLRPRVAGYIDSVHFTEGSQVARGDVLFRIDPRPYRAALAEALADLQRARTEADLARTSVDRARSLAASSAISTEQLDQREAALAEAEARIEAARAAVEIAELELDFTSVRSPIDGRAGRVLVTPGNLVGAGGDGAVLTTIVSIDPVYVHFEPDERSFLHLAAVDHGDGSGNPVRVALTGDADWPHEGQVDFVDNQVDPATGTIRVRATLANPDGRLTPGLFARVRLLERAERPALLVEGRAVLTDQDRKYVYVVNGDSVAERRDVVLGRQVDDRREVIAGLAAGEQVVVNGIQKIFYPGMPVQPLPEPERSLALAAGVTRP